MEIADWDIKDVQGLINKLKSAWAWHDYIRESWKGNLILELHTGGDSGNEQLIKELKRNHLFWIMFWWKSERGGHYYFEIDFKILSYKSVSEYIKEKGVSRQYVSQNKHKFDWVVISEKKKLIREKTWK